MRPTSLAVVTALAATGLLACADAPPRGEVIAEVTAHQLAAADGVVYTVDESGRLLAIDDAGNRVLAEGVADPIDMLVRDDRVWWGSDDIKSAPRVGGQPMLMSGNQWPLQFDVDDQWLYWSARGLGATRLGVWRQPAVGGEAMSVAPGVLHFQVVDGQVVWCQADGCWSKQPGSAVEPTLAFGTAPPVDDGWCIHDGSLYYVAMSSSDGPVDELWRVTGVAGVPELLFRTRTSATDDALSGNQLMVPMVAPGGQVYVWAVGKVFDADGDVVIEPTRGVQAVAFDQTSVYVADDLRVLRAPR